LYKNTIENKVTKTNTIMKKILTMIMLCGVCYGYAQNTPPFAATTKTWKIESPDGKIKQTWSDYIAVPACNKSDYIVGTGETLTADCRSYTYRSTTFYYYSQEYVDGTQKTLCPLPWHVPTAKDFGDLITAICGDERCCLIGNECACAHFLYMFGWLHGGLVRENDVVATDIEYSGLRGVSETYTSVWVNGIPEPYTMGAVLCTRRDTMLVLYTDSNMAAQGYQVRCVR
jgi:hypothetical protein